jgi:hypothetical protein
MSVATDSQLVPSHLFPSHSLFLYFPISIYLVQFPSSPLPRTSLQPQPWSLPVPVFHLWTEI